MELRDVIFYFKIKYKKIILACLFLASLGAITFFIVPIKYYATGSLFIKRAIYPYSDDHFTYEGYYGQQAAIAYTNSVIGLIETEDIRAQSLKNLGLEVTEQSLRVLSRKIKTIKSGPQVVTLIAKGSTSKEAQDLWRAVADSTIQSMEKLSVDGDPFVTLSKVSDAPIIKENYRNLPVFIMVGFFFGLILSCFYYSIENYLLGQGADIKVKGPTASLQKKGTNFKANDKKFIPTEGNK